MISSCFVNLYSSLSACKIIFVERAYFVSLLIHLTQLATTQLCHIPVATLNIVNIAYEPRASLIIACKRFVTNGENVWELLFRSFTNHQPSMTVCKMSDTVVSTSCRCVVYVVCSHRHKRPFLTQDHHWSVGNRERFHSWGRLSFLYVYM